MTAKQIGGEGRIRTYSIHIGMPGLQPGRATCCPNLSIKLALRKFYKPKFHSEYNGSRLKFGRPGKIWILPTPTLKRRVLLPIELQGEKLVVRDGFKPSPISLRGSNAVITPAD